jgi:hypothetical protein
MITSGMNFKSARATYQKHAGYLEAEGILSTVVFVGTCGNLSHFSRPGFLGSLVVENGEVGK